MTETTDIFDRDWKVPGLKPGDEIGSYHVALPAESCIRLETNYALLLVLLVAGLAMIVFDVWVFSQRVLSHVLLAWSSTTALAVKGAMIGLPLIGIPMVLYSLGRSVLIDAGTGVIQRRWLFAFGPKLPLASVARVELVLEAPVTETSDVNTRLLLVGAAGEPLLEFPAVYGERENLSSSDSTEFAKLLALARRVAALAQRPLVAKGAIEALSPVNRRMLGQVAS